MNNKKISFQLYKMMYFTERERGEGGMVIKKKSGHIKKCPSKILSKNINFGKVCRAKNSLQN